VNWRKVIPNAITFSRFPLGVASAVLILHDHFFTSAVVFLLAQATDVLDGNLARRWGTTSEFGRFADHLADKFLVFLMVGMFLVYGLVEPAFFYLIAVRDVLITSLRHAAQRLGFPAFLKTSKWGRRLSLIFAVGFTGLSLLAGVQLSYSAQAWLPTVWKGVKVLAWLGVGVKVGFLTYYLWRDRGEGVSMMGKLKEMLLK
jgi:CDP-diacylglycerol--glycerol-3-phosphate 3-phosphatidyltransferase